MSTLTTPLPGERIPLALRLLAAPVTAAVVLVGLWAAGGLVTNDFTIAMWLSGGWMALAGLLALAVAVRSRSLRVPVLGAYAVTAAAVTVYLGASVFFDDVVDEQVAVAGTGGAVLAAEGAFEPVAHAARGEAQVLERGARGRVLTLTGFAVDNGPDLRVYLVAGPATSEAEVKEYLDLGALKGNRGNQQYELPAAFDPERHTTIVIWCRAFSVLFARAPLEETT